MHTFHELHDIVSDGRPADRRRAPRHEDEGEREVECDVVLPMLGFVSDMGALAEWGLTLEKDEIVVNT